jgi:parvulin-like peptidyl-prolyl isomerase
MPRLIALSLLSLSFALSNTPDVQARTSAEQTAAQPGVSQPPAPKQEVIPPDQVIARIGDQVIHEKDFEDSFRVVAGSRFEQLSKAPDGLARFRQLYLDNQVLAAKARKAGLQRLPEFEQELKVQRDQILVRLLLNEEREGSEGQRLKQKAENPSEEEVKAFFGRNAQRFDVPERFTARHILVAVKGAPRMGDKGLSEEEAKAKIAKIQAELGAGKAFGYVAKEYSDDAATRNTGGLISDATFGGFAKEFEAAVRRQELGRVGDPVKTAFGYHLIVVESRTAALPAVYEQVRERVKQQMIPERRQAAYTDFLEQVRKEMGFVAVPAAQPSPPEGGAKPTGGVKP